MTLKQKQLDCPSEAGRENIFGWFIAAAVPLITILFHYGLGQWQWGLMDDTTILASGEGVRDRFWNYFTGLCEWGVFRPLFALHSAITYTLFENTPRFFYMMRLFEICTVLFMWGFAAYRLTGKRISVFLLPAVTLSFHYFYDAFFYLSSQEIIGLFFIGLSLLFYLNTLEVVLQPDCVSEKLKFKWLPWSVGSFFLLCALGAKEPFIACGIAFGLSYLWLAWCYRKTRLLSAFGMAGGGLIAITVIYAALLWIFIKTGYSNSYDLHDVAKLRSTLLVWFKKDFLNHMPWLAMLMFCFHLTKENEGRGNVSCVFPSMIQWGFCLGLFFYIGFVLILLPWNTASYYAAPLGLFFAFLVTLSISSRVSTLKGRWHSLFVICSLVINQFVCQYALIRESTYQYDTYNIMEWFDSNRALWEDRDKIVASNAMEPAIAIPKLLNKKYGLSLGPFLWSLKSDGFPGSQAYSFYLYSPRFYGIDLNILKNWEVVFFSKNWIMYKKKD